MKTQIYHIYVLGLKKKEKGLVSAWSLIAQNLENDYLLSKPRMQVRHKVMKVFSVYREIKEQNDQL